MISRPWDDYNYENIRRVAEDLHKQAQAKPQELTHENDQFQYWMGWAAHNDAMTHAYKFEFLWERADLSAKRLGAKWKEATEEVARLTEKIGILEAEIEVMRKLPGAVDTAMSKMLASQGSEQ